MLSSCSSSSDSKPTYLKKLLFISSGLVIPISQRLGFRIFIWSIFILVVCSTMSNSCSFILSVLSELPAANIVIPLSIVTTSSVFRLVVKNVFKPAFKVIFFVAEFF